jgi:hypothetical protein
VSCPRRNPLRASLQINPSVNMAWAAARPSSGCGDGTGLGSGTALARGPEESAPHEEYEEHGRIAIRGLADCSAKSMSSPASPEANKIQ